MRINLSWLGFTTFVIYISILKTGLAVESLPKKSSYSLLNRDLVAQLNLPFTNAQRQCQNLVYERTDIPSHYVNIEVAALEILANCDRNLATSPNNVIFLQNRAFALEVLGRYEEAIAIWNRLVAIDPRYQSNRDNAVRAFDLWTRWASNRALRVSDEQVRALTEALRLTIVNFKFKNPPLVPLYSDWKLPPRPIALMSKICLKRVVLPEEFAANPNLARSIVECVMRHHLNEESYETNNELEAVRRAASVFWAGTPNYNNVLGMVDFTQKVADFYQQLRSNSSPRK